MHQLGAHFKTTLTIGGAPMVLHDGDYAFQHQAFIPFDPIKLGPGDTILDSRVGQHDAPNHRLSKLDERDVLLDPLPIPRPQRQRLMLEVERIS